MDAEPYYLRLRRLRQERGLSQAELFRRVDGLGFDMIRALEMEPRPANGKRRPRWRYPTPANIEVLAAALGVHPEEFPEYLLAKAREQLDERAVSLDQALENYERWIAAMRTPRKATAAGRRARSRQESRPTPVAAPNDREAG